MRVAFHLFLAVVLLFTGASPDFWDEDNSGKIVACAAGANPAYREPMESCTDDRIITCFTLTSRLTPPDRSPGGAGLAPASPPGPSSSKENLKIYKLNAVFLI